MICIADPAEAAARDAAMAEQDTGTPQAVPPLPGVTTGIVRAGDPVAGELFVQGRVRNGDTTTRLDDVAGAGWRLVTMDPGVGAALSTPLGQWFADCGGAVVIIDAVDDVDGTYSTWFDEHDVVAVLQRPDFSLFGSAAGPADVEALVADLRSALEAGAAP